ncbi:hypothetical protein HNQ91_002870 [Filimonas zeae]|uniref:Metallophosphoesterase n=1 Tax=Filimonas zeae TaxID=1737353 RepID=A0A917J064_9BACT|nr:metallophosphoesterase [Filimonas zeae]MDR6339805.1 hypothetical protein [Filimonas zeae]GGH69735.1 metallophosphoesterase [Filimonas zeae]
MKLLIIPALLTCLHLTAQEPVDGPYIYCPNKDTAVAFTLLQQGDVLRSSARLIRRSGPGSNTFTVPVANHPEWNFTVQLHDAPIPPAEYEMPEQLFALSDIEGEFAAGRALLISGNVIDSQYNWTFGKGHLVVAGDLFDRGVDVLPWLWLLYSLEEKAHAAGGFVQVLLGNHDIMQLNGDYRYTDARFFKHAWTLGRDIRTLFDEDAELGRWLRSKNIIERTGSYLFMHAGLSPDVLRMNHTPEQINTLCRPWYAAARKNIPDSLQCFFDSRSPFWYRGYFASPALDEAVVDSTLQQYHCRTIVVGHTITDTTLAIRYHGKVLGIDVNQHEGHHAALLINREGLYSVDEKGNRLLLSLSKE